MGSTAALIVAAGRGERAGNGAPKQYREVAGRPLLRWSVDLFLGHQAIDAVQVVISPEQSAAYQAATGGLSLPPPVFGGAQRRNSVRNGLDALSRQSPTYVLIHDAARPLATPALVDRVIGALREGADAAVPMIEVGDTLKRRTDAGHWQTLPREGLRRAQTPQGFRFDKILAGHQTHSSADVTDDMAIAELAGMRIAAVDGEEWNLKVTKAEDFVIAERLLAAGGAETRTGMGFDAHRFVAGDHVWLCGVKIAHAQSLEGHSDADAGLHALTDAILGALGAGDIGQHFPPTDERWRGAPSSNFLAHAASLARDAGATIVHCDVTLICEAPKIGPHRDAMRKRIAEILGLDMGRVSVKATTTEGMGFVGREEGLAAQAVATIRVA
jgi:2-C-methyl-D-erythritol 4-phosphate cytidylyltransferase / 2-C-methyl-D-erythritol 2,4-cyclodiphosphate synthase